MAQESTSLSTGAAEPSDVLNALRKYLRNWYWFVLSLALCCLGAYLYLHYATPRYSIRGTLLIREEGNRPQFTSQGPFSELDIFRTSKNIDNEIEILRSKTLMRRALEDLSLYATYYVPGSIRDVEVYGRKSPIKTIISRLDSIAYGKTITIRPKGNQFELVEEDEDGRVVTSTHSFGQSVEKPYATFTVVANVTPIKHPEIAIVFHDIRKLAESYNQRLMVGTINTNASVLAVSLVDPVPNKGVDILTSLITRYNEEAVEDKKQIAAYTIEFIDERLTYLTSELSDVEKDVEQYKQKNELTDVNSETQLYLQRANEYNKQLAEFAIQVDVLTSIQAYLLGEESENGLVPSSLSIQDPTLMGLIAKFNELQLERQRMLRTTRPNNPIVLSISEQLHNLRTNILENLRNIKSGLLITQENLQKKSKQFESRIQQVPMMERELLEINRQQSIKQQLYLFLLTKREESGLSLASTVANSRVIDPPQAGDLPVSPKKRQILLLAVLLGLGLPLAFIYTKELLNNKVRTRKDVETATPAPILGEIIRSKHKTPLAVVDNSQTPVSEMFQLIRYNLQFSTLGQENKVLLVTSSRSGEGKTFFSINLGATMASVGKKVVVVSLDLRKPKLMEYLRLSDNQGVSDYVISDTFSAEALTVPVPNVPGLFALGTGLIPPNPGELIANARIASLLTELREHFDLVLIDTSPVGQVADAFALAPYVDSTIYLVRYDYTYKAQLAIIDDIYRDKKLNHPMIVMNDAKKKNNYRHGYGYGYGYTNGKSNGAKARPKRKKSRV